MCKGSAENKNKEHQHYIGLAETGLDHFACSHIPGLHQRNEAGQARPGDSYKDPSIHHSQENPQDLHPQNRDWIYGRQITEPKHNDQANRRINIVFYVPVFLCCC